ncbi:MFS transporter [Saccharopolyspora rosea]|uniref:MFS transporter n=1 Tax=Saccharopolyspora rosea TaxID=524884 RepID=A0ABW3FW16_9PSEU|nr:MFS transporter [Saccharopolyspora rosea]
MSAAHRPPRVLSLASLISNFDRFAVTPLLVLIAAGLGVPFAAAVTAASGYFLAYGLSQPVWGVLSDRFGRVALLRWTLFGAALAGLASAVAPTLPALVAARLLAGACFGAVVPTSLTYVGDTVPQPWRQSALSDLMAGMAVGMALATAVGGVLASLLDWRAVFALPALCAAGCGVLVRGLAEPPRAGVDGVREHLRSVLTDRWALLVFGLGFGEGAVLLGALALLASALVRQGVDVAVAGLATGAYGLAVLLFSRVVKKLARRVEGWQLIAIGGVQLFLGYAVVAVVVAPAAVVVTALLLGGAWSFLHSSLQNWTSEVAPRARGTAVSLFTAALFLGSAAASAAAGPLAQRGAYGTVFTVAAVAAVPLAVVAAASRRRYQRLSAAPRAERQGTAQ